MHQIAPDEFRVIQRDPASGVTRLHAPGGKSDRILGKGKYPVVGNGDLMGVASEILNGIAKAVKGLLDVRTPVFFIEPVFPFPEAAAILKMDAGGRKDKGTVFMETGKACQVFPFELVPEDLDRDKESAGRKADLTVPGQASGGNDAVHMDMVIQFLVPGMEDLYDAGGGAEIFFIGGQLKQGFGTAFVQKAVKKPLVAVNEGIQFMGERKHHMKVRGINDLGPAFIDPDFL